MAENLSRIRKDIDRSDFPVWNGSADRQFLFDAVRRPEPPVDGGPDGRDQSKPGFYPSNRNCSLARKTLIRKKTIFLSYSAADRVAF